MAATSSGFGSATRYFARSVSGTPRMWCEWKSAEMSVPMLCDSGSGPPG